jgi:glycosyltransferase involved in cell wall biosynthesis
MKLLEYMSAGGAVISNTSSAFGMTLTHRRDYYRLDGATPEELARAIGDLIDDEKGIREIGRNARALVLSHFSWARTAESLLAVVDEVGGDR